MKTTSKIHFPANTKSEAVIIGVQHKKRYQNIMYSFLTRKIISLYLVTLILAKVLDLAQY